MNASLQSAPKSKAAKKRAAKRRKNALQELNQNSDPSAPNPPENLLQKLKNDFELAKSSGDTEKTRAIREQIWLLHDANAGVQSDITKEQLKEILGSVERQHSEPSDGGIITSEEHREMLIANQERANEASVSTKIEYLEKQLRKLQKKQAQIEKLKERLQNGESLEKTQINKIDRAKALEDEIDDVEEELYKLKRM